MKLWDLIDEVHRSFPGATALHLAVGKPPIVRTAERELMPLTEDIKYLGYQDIMLMLQLTIEPERWASLENMGEGEILLTPQGGGRPITLTVYRSSEAWQAVVHF